MSVGQIITNGFGKFINGVSYIITNGFGPYNPPDHVINHHKSNVIFHTKNQQVAIDNLFIHHKLNILVHSKNHYSVSGKIINHSKSNIILKPSNNSLISIDIFLHHKSTAVVLIHSKNHYAAIDKLIRPIKSNIIFKTNNHLSNIENVFDNFSKTRNQFFNFTRDYQNEWMLYDSLLTEAYNKNGSKADYYISSYDLNNDKVFGEDSSSDRRYVRTFPIMIYHNLPKEQEMWSKFGIEGLDNFMVYVSKKHFKTASTSYIPRPGDILQTKYNNRIYEIVDVGEEDEVYLQRKHTWTLTLQVWKNVNIPTSPILSGSGVAPYVNEISDIFDLSAVVDQGKGNFLYNGDQDKSQPSDIWGKW